MLAPLASVYQRLFDWFLSSEGPDAGGVVAKGQVTLRMRRLRSMLHLVDIDGVEPGRDVHVAARTPAPEGGVPARFALERIVELAAGGQRSDLLLTLVESRSIAGRVLSSEGEPIAGARVRAWIRLDTRTTSGVTGETLHVDCGYHIVGMKHPDAPDITVAKDE